MTNQNLRTSLIKLAHQNPDLRPHLLPILTASIDKTAIAKDTVDFVSYIMSTAVPMHSHDVMKFLLEKGKLHVGQPVQRRQGPRFFKGDRIEIKASKHKNMATKAPYLEYNGKVGTVVAIDKLDVLVQMDTGPSVPVRFPLGMSPRGVGIYKYTPPYVIEGSPAMEMVYLRNPDADTSADQRLTVDVYMAGAGKYEERPAIYYTGHVAAARWNQEGDIYFLKCPQQRLRVDPAAEGGLEYRAFNPTKGKVLYMGLLGKRPTDWKDKLAELKKLAPERADTPPMPAKKLEPVEDDGGPIDFEMDPKGFAKKK